MVELIDLNQTHIRLSTDLKNHNLKKYILKIRKDLENYIRYNQDFLWSLEPLTENEENLAEIVHLMYESSKIANVGPMACVAGTISHLSLKYLMNLGSKCSIIENGGDIAIVNNRKIVCGIYSNNKILTNSIGFQLKASRKPLGICTSSGKIGHSISFGQSDSVTVISDNASKSDGLATRIANEVLGPDSETAINNALEVCESFKEHFRGVLIIAGDNVGTIGHLPKLVETKEFEVKI